ncbi:MAG: hypothetical protein H6748_11565 [Spirochaetaceae bacterium]|nr:hypothetical protein [Myxococcales bacterium]MCB9724674.1 hypothetical protein [Spirochaetaceae bacterium]HPG26142.1 hypothetical protein [Myxococcota bacterium]
MSDETSGAPAQEAPGARHGGHDGDAGGGHGPRPGEDFWLDRPGSVDLIIKLLIGAGVAVVAADFFYHKHGEFHFQEYFAFDAVFGFAAYVGLITAAKGFRKIVMRGEDYYD